jgi:cellobiose-specific phosphotransferase system component IIC
MKKLIPTKTAVAALTILSVIVMVSISYEWTNHFTQKLANGYIIALIGYTSMLIIALISWNNNRRINK